MEPIEIYILMKRARITYAAIAQKFEVTPAMIEQVVKGRRHTQYIREAIAEAVGKPVEKLWPQTNNKRKAA
jgi:transcriptional regulator with XRE-family HTH domain